MLFLFRLLCFILSIIFSSINYLGLNNQHISLTFLSLFFLHPFCLSMPDFECTIVFKQYRELSNIQHLTIENCQQTMRIFFTIILFIFTIFRLYLLSLLNFIYIYCTPTHPNHGSSYYSSLSLYPYTNKAPVFSKSYDTQISYHSLEQNEGQ
jgi:hypothetical protein